MGAVGRVTTEFLKKGPRLSDSAITVVACDDRTAQG